VYRHNQIKIFAVPPSGTSLPRVFADHNPSTLLHAFPRYSTIKKFPHQSARFGSHRFPKNLKNRRAKQVAPSDPFNRNNFNPSAQASDPRLTPVYHPSITRLTTRPDASRTPTPLSSRLPLCPLCQSSALPTTRCSRKHTQSPAIQSFQTSPTPKPSAIQTFQKHDLETFGHSNILPSKFCSRR
jgi:hypothetical protein